MQDPHPEYNDYNDLHIQRMRWMNYITKKECILREEHMLEMLEKERYRDMERQSKIYNPPEESSRRWFSNGDYQWVDERNK